MEDSRFGLPPSDASSDAPVIPPPPRRIARRVAPRRRWWKRLLWIGLFGVGVFLGLSLLSSWFFGPVRVVEEGSWLEVRFSSSYPESRPDRTGLRGALEPTDLSAADLRAALDAVCRDPRIQGVLLRGDGFSGSWAQVEELRESIGRLRQAHKEVVAYVDFASSRAYALASSADEIVMAPEGMLMTIGLQARMTYLAGTLDKLGVFADFVAVGDYKSAPEQFQRDSPSDASREQTQALLEDVWRWWYQGVASDRNLSVREVLDAVESAPLDAEAALARGWVDEVEDLGDWIDRRGIDVDRQWVEVSSYLANLPEDERPARVAVVYVDGSIASGGHGTDPVLGPIAGSDTVIERLRRARQDDAVAAIVLRIDSPGGAASASHGIYREVTRATLEKPVVASMAGTAASGGYYVAMAADEIVADSLTVTGSIGVFSGKLVLSGLYEKVGISHATLRTTDDAGMFDDLEPFDEAQRRRLRAQLESFYERFVTRVATERGLDLPAARRAAGGRVWSGRQARLRGLVDTLGGFDRAVRRAEALAGLEEGASRSFDYRPSPGWYERLLQELFRARVATEVWTGWWKWSLPPASRALDGAVQYRLPWQWSVE